MRLENCELRPGVVVDVCDSYGVIKASCAGYFSEEDDPDLLPPVYPFFQASASSFNQPQINDLIWVMTNSENPQELFYMFRSNLKSETDGALERAPKDSTILVCRDAGFSKAKMSYDTEDGWIIQNDSADITIDEDGDIILTGSSGNSVTIDSEGVHLAGINGEAAVLGDTLQAALRKLSAALHDTALVMRNNPYTEAAGRELEGAIYGFDQEIEKILSDKVTLE